MLDEVWHRWPILWLKLQAQRHEINALQCYFIDLGQVNLSIDKFSIKGNLAGVEEISDWDSGHQLKS